MLWRWSSYKNSMFKYNNLTDLSHQGRAEDVLRSLLYNAAEHKSTTEWTGEPAENGKIKFGKALHPGQEPAPIFQRVP
ncbi:hypothetical protein GDO81_011842 [Engystomops pustulosus]|uniref:Uncharacterized protein n=1 Tax=Engystomops pustulosus TaxID=76066 RepID=A0AAV7BHH9_ENGPU|nr:hypothetical protein GDO81_011842 [Engystomops pustulosus]